MIKEYDPDWKPPAGEPLYGATDLTSLRAEPVAQQDMEQSPYAAAEIATDFRSLKNQAYGKRTDFVPRTWTDWLIDGLTPLFILIMAYTVIFFLLDVRYIYTEVHDANLRAVAFFFLLGIVALNRLVARDGSGESMLYSAALAGTVGLYTLSTTGAYDVGSVARNFMNDSPWLATLFNMIIAVFIWWLVNRLTHECCVDENREAGDIGILTGTARRMRAAIQPRVPVKKPERPRRRLGRAPQGSELFPMNVLEPFDPTEGFQPKPDAAPVDAGVSLRDKLARRHPGISIFYFSVPVMFLFALGLRVVQRGGEAFVDAGKFYMGVYTVSALMLLMLTSLSGLRQYFRARGIAMPARIGPFWIALGILQIAVVLVAATRLPMPSLPPAAHVDEHQTDYWSRNSDFQLSPMAATPVDMLEQSRIIERVSNVVLAALALFLLYGAVRALGAAAARIARQRDRWPRPVLRFFDRLDAVLLRLSRLPAPRPRARRRLRISADVAVSSKYSSSLASGVAANRSARDHIEHAYQALGALAYDLGVPREEGQTPYEFLARFPEELRALREEARDLTNLYVMAAYSEIPLDERTLDRLRKFWITYNRVRNRYVH